MKGFIARLGIFLLAIISFSTVLVYGGAAWAPLPEGIPDSGQATSWTLQLAILAHVILGLRVFGLLVTWTFIAPSTGDTISRDGRTAVLHASAIATLWSLSAVIAGLTTMANVLGVPFREVFRQGFIATYLMYLPPSRSYIITALIALAIAIAGVFLVSLNSIALLAALAGAGIAAPLLNSHAASLGSHSLALTSSVAHGLAMSAWVGCLWAVSAFVKAKDLKVVARFSSLAAASVAVLAISGIAAAYARLDSISDLWLSRYGQIVILKTIFFALLMWLAIQIRARLTSTGSLTKFLSAEVAIMATAIGVGVALHSTPMSRISAPLNSAGEEILGFAYPPAPTLSTIVFGWNPEWTMLTISLITAALYSMGVIRVKQNQIKWSTLRTISFMIGIGLVILFIIYLVRAITLFIFNGKNIVTQLFLAPRGLITILLFFAIPEELSIGPEFQGVLLFVILVSCLVMTWSLISYKNKLAQIGEYEDEELLAEKEIEEEASEPKE